MFHHFPDELNGTADYLVRSTDLEYRKTPVASFISSVTQAGYVQQADRTYLKRALPKLELNIRKSRSTRRSTTSIRRASGICLVGSNGTRYRWVDLDSEGLTGVLTEQAQAWYYKRNSQTWAWKREETEEA